MQVNQHHLKQTPQQQNQKEIRFQEIELSKLAKKHDSIGPSIQQQNGQKQILQSNNDNNKQQENNNQKSLFAQEEIYHREENVKQIDNSLRKETKNRIEKDKQENFIDEIATPLYLPIHGGRYLYMVVGKQRRAVTPHQRLAAVPQFLLMFLFIFY